MKSNTHNLKRGQNGGTILGIIIGLVIGLSIAVIVAVMITKSSTPFTNKLGITKSGDAPAMQLTDPNKPLYGSSAKEIMANANKQSDVGNGPGNPANSVGPVTNAASAQPAVRLPDVVKQDQKEDLKTVKLLDTTTKKNDTDEKAASYYLQVGAYRDSLDAESTRAKLALMGVESRISTTDADSLYRVRIGPFDQTDSMNRMRAKLSENSIDVAVIKTPK